MEKYLVPILLLLSIGLFAQSSKAYKKAIKKHRIAYKKAFLEEVRSPFEHKSELKNLRFYPPNEAYRVQAKFTRTAAAKPFKMMTSSGMEKIYVQHGTLDFEVKGEATQLAVYTSPMLQKMPGYKDYLFIPFKDKTNGNLSYGGGRYLELRTGAIKGNRVVLDFNKAYNPYCAFKEGYNCPIPPKENHLAINIEAGEQNYALHK